MVDSPDLPEIDFMQFLKDFKLTNDFTTKTTSIAESLGLTTGILYEVDTNNAEIIREISELKTIVKEQDKTIQHMKRKRDEDHNELLKIQKELKDIKDKQAEDEFPLLLGIV